MNGTMRRFFALLLTLLATNSVANAARIIKTRHVIQHSSREEPKVDNTVSGIIDGLIPRGAEYQTPLSSAETGYAQGHGRIPLSLISEDVDTLALKLSHGENVEVMPQAQTVNLNDEKSSEQSWRELVKNEVKTHHDLHGIKLGNYPVNEAPLHSGWDVGATMRLLHLREIVRLNKGAPANEDEKTRRFRQYSYSVAAKQCAACRTFAAVLFQDLSEGSQTFIDRDIALNTAASLCQAHEFDRFLSSVDCRVHSQLERFLMEGGFLAQINYENGAGVLPGTIFNKGANTADFCVRAKYCRDADAVAIMSPDAPSVKYTLPRQEGKPVDLFNYVHPRPTLPPNANITKSVTPTYTSDDERVASVILKQLTLKGKPATLASIMDQLIGVRAAGERHFVSHDYVFEMSTGFILGTAEEIPNGPAPSPAPAHPHDPVHMPNVKELILEEVVDPANQNAASTFGEYAGVITPDVEAAAEYIAKAYQVEDITADVIAGIQAAYSSVRQNITAEAAGQLALLAHQSHGVIDPKAVGARAAELGYPATPGVLASLVALLKEAGVAQDNLSQVLDGQWQKLLGQDAHSGLKAALAHAADEYGAGINVKIVQDVAEQYGGEIAAEPAQSFVDAIKNSSV